MSYERRKIRVGKVVSDKMDQTVVVLIESRHTHPLYKKAMRRRARFKVHDESNTSRVGDLVRIIEARPLSKTKRWRLVEVLARGETAEIQPEEVGVEALAEVAPTAESVVEETVVAEAEAPTEPEPAVEPVPEEAEEQAEPEPEPAVEPAPEKAEEQAEPEPAEEPAPEEPEEQAEPEPAVEPAPEEAEEQAEPEPEPAVEPAPEEAEEKAKPEPKSGTKGKRKRARK